MFLFKGDGLIKDFYGNYSEFREPQKEEEKQLKSREKKNISIEKTEKKSFYKQKYEYGELEKIKSWKMRRRDKNLY